MKQALYYAIRRNLYSTVVAVTSEKGTRRWHGRDCKYNEATHGTFDQLRGRFPTQEAAEKCREGVLAIDAKFDTQIEVHRQATTRLYRECRDEIDAYIKANSNEPS